MLDALKADILVEELQLGEKLNSCVQQSRRSDFALMLAMLADDVRAHSQFHLPKTTATNSVEDENLLRKRFDLPAAERLALNKLSEIDEYSQAALVETQQLTAIHLQQAMKPRPLAFRDDKNYIPQNVLGNTSLYCQRQHRQEQVSGEQHLDFNVNEWLKAVKNSLVKAPLVELAA